MSAVGNFEVLSQAYGPFTDSSEHLIQLTAPSGKVLLGAGIDEDTTGSNVRAVHTRNYPNATSTVWNFIVRGQGSALQPASGTVYATCAEMGG